MTGHIDTGTPLGMLRAFVRYKTHGGYVWAAVMADAELMCERCCLENYGQVYRATQAWQKVHSVRESHAFPREMEQWAVIGLQHSGESESTDYCANCNKVLWEYEEENDMSEPTDNKPNRESFRADMIELATRLIPAIGDDYRIEGQEDDTPMMQVTVGCDVPSNDSMSWSYQTGDNSYSGGAYGYAFWGIVYLTRDMAPADFADEMIRSLEDNEDFSFEVEL